MSCCNNQFEVKYVEDKITGEVSIQKIIQVKDENGVIINPPITMMAGTPEFDAAIAAMDPSGCVEPIVDLEKDPYCYTTPSGCEVYIRECVQKLDPNSLETLVTKVVFKSPSGEAFTRDELLAVPGSELKYGECGSDSEFYVKACG